MIKLYADGADYDSIVELSKNKNVVGFTTNPTLMRQAGVENYEEFSKKVIQYLSKNRPNTSLSLEVFADEKSEMLNQAEKPVSVLTVDKEMLQKKALIYR